MKIKDLLTKRPFVRVQPSALTDVQPIQDRFTSIADYGNLTSLHYPQYKYKNGAIF